MKKNLFMLFVLASSMHAGNGDSDIRTALMALENRLGAVSNELSKPPVPPRDDQGLSLGNGTPPPPPPYEVTETKPLTPQETEQLKKVLQDLIGDQFIPKEDAQEITTQEFLHNITVGLYRILQGFDYGSKQYIGYPTYSGVFLERFLQDYDKAVALIRAASPEDKNLKTYDKWRPRLVAAVGKMPNQK